MDSEQLIRKLIEHLYCTTSLAGPVERPYIVESLALLHRCAENGVPKHLSAIIYDELLSQLEWIKIYASHQTKYPTYRVTSNASLVPKTEDNEILLVRFLKEILEGAYALQELIGIPRDVRGEWKCVQRHCEKQKTIEDDRTPSIMAINTEIDHESDNTYEDNIPDVFSHKYWYF